jgi:glyoxylate/hydroxypyruvate reductase
MRIHIQTPPPGHPFEVTHGQWESACLRAHEPNHTVSFSVDQAGFETNMPEAELLVAPAAVIAALLPVYARHLVHAPHLKLVFLLSVGVEKLAPFSWLPPGVPLLNNRGVQGPKMFEYALASFLMIAHRIPAAVTGQRAHEWNPTALYTPVARGKRATVVGTGKLGSVAGRAARLLGLEVTGVRTRPEAHPDFDRTVTVAALDDILPTTELLLLACPLTPLTRNLISRDRLAALRQGAGVINASRGEVLDQDALCDLLDSGHLSGAILDVLMLEPPPNDSRVWTTPNLIITPHVSTDDPSTNIPASLDILFENLRAWRDGRPMSNVVDTTRGY